MIKCWLLVFISFIAEASYAQFINSYQPSAIYKQNHVKARIQMFDYSLQNSKIVTYFDTSGHRTAIVYFDTTGQRISYKMFFSYDSNKHLSKTVIYNYKDYDTTGKKYFLKDTPDIETSSITYDSLKRIKEMVFTNTAGAITLKCDYSYRPYIEDNTWFRKDKSILKEILTYEDSPIPIKADYTTHTADDEIVHVEYVYKNIFDKDGTIRKTILQQKSSKAQKELYFKEYNYSYAGNGLLVKRANRQLSDNSGRISSLIFDYKFW